MMRKLLFLVLMLLSLPVYSASSYQSGNIENLTAVTSGILIKMDSGVPDNCHVNRGQTPIKGD